MHVSLQILLVSLLVFTPLAYGGVTLLGLSVLEFCVYSAALLWLIDAARRKEIVFLKTALFVPLLIFLLFAAFQLIALPQVLIKSISWHTYRLYRDFANGHPAAGNFIPLSISPELSLGELLRVLSYFLTFFLAMNLFVSKRYVHLYINVLIFLGLGISIWGIIGKFSNSASSSFGPFVNRNSFSGYINMVIPLGLGYSFSEMPLAKRVIYGFSIGVMSLGLFLSLSRSGILAYIFCIMLFILLLGSKEKLKEKGGSLIYFWILTIFCLLIFLGQASAIISRFRGLFSDQAFVVFGHGYPWKDILRIWNDFPLFGIGLGTFSCISPMYKSIPVQSLFTYAHNDYLQLLTEAGAVGFLAVAVFFLAYLRQVLANWRKRHDHFAGCVVLGGIVSVSGMLLYSLLDFNLHIPANAFLFFFIMGIVYRLSFGGLEASR